MPYVNRDARNAYQREFMRQRRAMAAEHPPGDNLDSMGLTALGVSPSTSSVVSPGGVFPKVADKAILRNRKQLSRQSTKDRALAADAIHERMRWTEENVKLNHEAIWSRVEQLESEIRDLKELVGDLVQALHKGTIRAIEHQEGWETYEADSPSLVANPR